MPEPKPMFALGDAVIEEQPSCVNGQSATMKTAVVTKVGRKWVFINGEHEPRDHKFGISDGIAYYDPNRENGYYRPRLYTFAAYEAKQRREAAEERLRRLEVQVSRFGQSPWTTEALEAVADILEAPGAREGEAHA